MVCVSLQSSAHIRWIRSLGDMMLTIISFDLMFRVSLPSLGDMMLTIISFDLMFRVSLPSLGDMIFIDNSRRGFTVTHANLTFQAVMCPTEGAMLTYAFTRSNLHKGRIHMRVWNSRHSSSCSYLILRKTIILLVCTGFVHGESKFIRACFLR